MYLTLITLARERQRTITGTTARLHRAALTVSFGRRIVRTEKTPTSTLLDFFWLVL
jgi:hypothetical protein